MMFAENSCMKTKEHTEEIDVQKYWLVIKRRFPVIALVFLTASGLSILVAMRQKPAYEVVAKLLIKSDNASLTGLNVKIGELNPLGTSQIKDPLITQAETLKSLPIFKQAVQSVRSPVTAGRAITPEYLLENFKVKAITGTDVLQISYASDNPAYATAIVNAVIKEYIASNISANREEAAAARRFIDSQLPQTAAAVRKAEMDLRQFKERGQIIALNQETIQAVTNIGNLDTQIDQARATFADARARSTEFRRQLGMNPAAAVDLSALKKSSGVQEVLTKLQTTQSQLAVEQTRYRDTHPTVINLQQQVNSLNALLTQRVAEVTNRNQPVPIGQLQLDDLKQNITASYLQSEVDLNGISQRITELTALQATYKQRTTNLPALEKTQRELERQLKAAQATYETLLAKLQEVQVAENQRLGNVRVVQSATAPDKPSPARKSLTIAAGSIAGLLFGMAAAFLIDVLDQSVNTLKAIREQFDYPLLGVVPASQRWGWRWGKLGADFDRTALRIMRRDRPRSSEDEAYQMLQSNLAFLMADRGLQSIVVTSSMPGEGKSEVAANLAVELAQLGRRVLLVDTNMTHPSLHAAWDRPNAFGLSHVLRETLKVDEAVQEVMPNLYLLPTGGGEANPMALLDSNRMIAVMTELSSRYDFIIFDAAAVNCWTDASVLSRMIDGILLVVRPGIVTRSAIDATVAKLANVRQKVLGVVANGVNLSDQLDRHMPETNHYTINPDRNYPGLDQVPLKRNNSRV
jgi:polysaccharide biosynthesis transport protein